MMNIRQIDLNLLSLLVRIAETGSVSVAGAQLGLSQPASSNALARLRQALGDPLFQRTREGMVPTGFAEAILPGIREHMAGIEATLTSVAGFDPGTSRRRFRLSLSGLGEQNFLPRLAATVFDKAPFVTLENVSSPAGELAETLSSRRADIAIGLIDLALPTMRQQVLFRDDYRVIASPALAARGPVDLTRARLILVAPSATFAREIEAMHTRLGLADRVCLRMSHFGALPAMLDTLEAAAIVPGQFAAKLAEDGGAVLLPARADLGRQAVNLVWHERTETDPGCQWLRGIVTRLFAKDQS